MRTRPRGPADARANAGADVLVVVEDVVGIVRGLHLHQPVVDGVAVRLADPAGVFVAAEEVDVDAFAEAAEGGEEPLRPGGVPVAEVLAGPPHTIEGDCVRRLPIPERRPASTSSGPRRTSDSRARSTRPSSTVGTTTGSPPTSPSCATTSST